jgi:capsular exopolysaccharide synthesis family protein
MKLRNESDPAIAFLKLLLEKLFSLKYLYIASVVIFVGLAVFYIKYAPKVYELNATIGPVKDTRSASLTGEMFSGGTFYRNNIEDAINSLMSFSLVSKTVNDLKLEIGYFVDSKKLLIKQSTEIYLTSPFVVSIDKSHLQPIDAKFYITILDGSTFRLTASKKKTFLYDYINNEIAAEKLTLNVDTICRFNETITNRYFKFSVSLNNEYLSKSNDEKKDKDNYYFVLYHPEALAKLYLKSLEVQPLSYMASIIKVQFSSNNLKKSLNFLNRFIDSFLEENLAKKNKIALSTINFIDNQISEMSDSLVQSQSTLRNFRTDNAVMDLSFQGQRIYEQLAQIENEKTNIGLQTRYYNYVLNYFKTNQDISGVTPPSSASIADPFMNSLFADLYALFVERSAFPNTSEKNVFLVQVDNKIKIQKQTIIDNITSTLNTLNLNLNELNAKAEKLSRDMSNLPRKEMNMVNIQRKFDLNNTLYTYLLQKRSESAITLSSTYPDFEVLEPAREITSKITSPKVKMNFIIALFLGLLFPSMYLLTNLLLNNKLTSVYEMERLLDGPVFGLIYNNHKKYEAVITESPGSAISESFRNLRSSLFLKLKSNKSKVILITSAQPQDGKSFISFNLSAAIASVGFKTVLIDCDLRRSVLHTKFNKDNSPGITNYMVRKSNEDEIIHGTPTENLFLIPAGPVIPNPSELIGSGILDNFIESLKLKFEYIIIDTPPVGLVADATQLMKYADQILVVVRTNYTRKDILTSALTSLETNQFDNYEVVMNDVILEKSPYSNYKSYYHKE